MKFFTNKSIWSKIIIVLIFVLLFEFVVAKPTLGAGVSENIIEGGGTLLKPVMSLVVTIGDGFMAIMQKAILGNLLSTVPVDVEANFWEILGQIITAGVAVLACFAMIAGAIASGVGVVGAIAVIAKSILTLGAGAVIGTFVVPAVTEGMASGTMSNISASVFPDTVKIPATLYMPIFNYSPEAIFEGKILLFNVDFFGEPIKIQQDPDGNYYYMEGNEKVITSPQNIAEDLSGLISSWYVGIRNIALVVMMIVLLYIAIRMMLSTLASDKAKHKEMLKDWLMGMLLLFLMHYIMVFSVTVVQKLTKIISASVDENVYAVKFPMDDNNKIAKWFNENGLAYMLYDENNNPMAQSEGDKIEESRYGDVAYAIYMTNSIGKARLDLQFDTGTYSYVGEAICYLILVFFTVYFTFVYLKRVLYMAFLTMIAPVVAVTYPIDKISDGSAQGFSKWFKEYIFNLLLQPLHLLLYFTLITSAFNLAGANIVYSIVALGFMLPAERLLRSFFGFEKANTSGALSGAAGGALAMAGINKLSSVITNRNHGSSGKNLGTKEDNGTYKEAKSPFVGDVDKTEALSEGFGGEGDTPVRTANDTFGQEDGEGPSRREEIPVAPGQTTLDLGDEYSEQLNGNIPNVTSGNEQGERETPQVILGQTESNSGEENSQTERIRQVNQDDEKQKDELETKKYSKEEINNRVKGEGEKLSTKQRVIRGVAKAAVRTAPLMEKAAMVYKPVARFAGAATAGSLALAAGIATGDPSNALQYGAAGVGAGYMAGKSASDATYENRSQFLRNREDMLKKLAERDEHNEFAKSELMKIRAKDYKKAFKKNGYDDETIKRMQDDGTINRYIDNDINAQKAVVAEKYREETGATQKKAIALSKYTDRVGDAYEKADSDKWKKQLSGEFQDKSKLSPKMADKAAKETWDGIGTMRKIEKRIKDVN